MKKQLERILAVFLSLACIALLFTSCGKESRIPVSECGFDNIADWGQTLVRIEPEISGSYVLSDEYGDYVVVMKDNNIVWEFYPENNQIVTNSINDDFTLKSSDIVNYSMLSADKLSVTTDWESYTIEITSRMTVENVPVFKINAPYDAYFIPYEYLDTSRAFEYYADGELEKYPYYKFYLVGGSEEEVQLTAQKKDYGLSDIVSAVTGKIDLSDKVRGDIVEFGSYPQSQVYDSTLLSELNALELDWVSYGYYSGSGEYRDTQNTTAKDYMKYADVTIGIEKYRAVSFTEYRPDATDETQDMDSSYQDDNGYYANTIYWFKYEPLKWRVLDPTEGFLLCESIVDNQPFNNNIYYDFNDEARNYLDTTKYASDYETSDIRAWLNDDFYNLAFTDDEKEQIAITECDNRCWTSYYPEYDSETTFDKIFLLSSHEIENPDYGFNPDTYNQTATSLIAYGTDYAKCQGLEIYNNASMWYMRTPDNYDSCANGVDCVGNYCDAVGVTDVYGVRPALKIAQ